MTWTYTGSPATVYADAVRFQCGDTDTNNQQLQDGEIAAGTAKYPANERLAAAFCLDALASKYAAKATFSVGQISKQMGNVAENLRQQAALLRREAGKLAGMFFGGLTKSGKVLLDNDLDAVKQPFCVGQFDSPLAPSFDGSRKGGG